MYSYKRQNPLLVFQQILTHRNGDELKQPSYGTLSMFKLGYQFES